MISTYTKVWMMQGFSSVYKPRREGAIPFGELLEAVAKAVPEMRIRFTSPHPKDFSDEVLQVMASHYSHLLRK